MIDQEPPPLKRPANAVRPPPAAVALRIKSFSDLVALLGLLGGCLYLYSRAYNAVFLSSFGLGVGVIPMSLQDAMVDGLEGVTINILYLWVPVAMAFLLYFLWKVGSRFFEPEQRTSGPLERAPTSWWAKRGTKVQADTGMSRLFTLLVSIIAAPAILLGAVILVALPAELSARKDVAALRALVAGGCAKCATYEIGAQRIIGRPIASTGDRIFVLRHDGLVMPIRLDDLRTVMLAPKDPSRLP
jgi:hypothetical protein